MSFIILPKAPNASTTRVVNSAHIFGMDLYYSEASDTGVISIYDGSDPIKYRFEKDRVGYESMVARLMIAFEAKELPSADGPQIYSL